MHRESAQFSRNATALAVSRSFLMTSYGSHNTHGIPWNTLDSQQRSAVRGHPCAHLAPRCIGQIVPCPQVANKRTRHRRCIPAEVGETDAHHDAQLLHCDVVEIDEGEIVEIGSHEQLMEAQGAYYTLYQAQLRHAAELVEGGAIGESLEESPEEKQQEKKVEKLEVIAKNIGGGV